MNESTPSVKKIPSIFIKGSLGWTKMKCGNARCKCAKGELHTACYLSYRRAGKTITVHIPKALAATVEQYCRNWNQYKEHLEEKTHKTVTKLLESHRKKGSS